MSVRVGPANLLTTLRFLLVVPIAVLILRELYWTALLVYSVAMATDVLDGVIARRRRADSRFGAILDPVADIAANTAVFGALFANDLVPLWIIVLLGVRYGMLFVGSAVLWLSVGPIRFKATPVGKIVGVLQAAIAIIILVFAATGRPWQNATAGALYSVLGVLFAAVIVSQGMLGIRHIRQSALNE